MTASATAIQRVDRAEIQRHLPQLDAWLLDGAVYGVQHTWPQLYRGDGDGMFFVLTDGERLLSHCACRTELLVDGDVAQSVGLLGSVATAPAARGRGLAGQVLQAAIDALAETADRILLWAERPELYARTGFAPTANDRCLMLARGPRREQAAAAVRLATVLDHETLHALHEQKPRRIHRSIRTMSTLLTTPGMTTVVLERDGEAVAYACTGKGADLHGHWHDLGGSDRDLAELIPAAMHITDQIEAALLLPPYRRELGERLAAQVVAEIEVPGPMARGAAGADAARRPCWIDGLDSV